MKVCPRCKQSKPLSEYHKNGTDTYCKPCRLDYGREWRQAHPDAHKAYKRAAEAKKPDQYRAAKRRRYHADVEHSRELQRAWAASHPEVMKKRRRASVESGYTRWHRYGISLEASKALMAAQDWTCAICRGNFPSSRGTQLDHDHATGEVRGFLCSMCNHDVAKFERLRGKVADYLADPPARSILAMPSPPV